MATAAAAPPSPIPPLRDGDRIDRLEFERRYDAIPDLKKAELIDGVVHLGPPAVPFWRHAEPHFYVVAWLGFYTAYTPGTEGADNGSIRLDLDNMPQPDAFLIINPENGGRVKISEEDYVEGAPELVVEVAYSSVSYDLNAKLHVYRRNEAQEYVVWRVEDETIDWFRLREGRYERLPLSGEGQYQSDVFPGLWLDPEALIRGDMAAVFGVIQQGIASPEHAAFVDRLRAASPNQVSPT